MDRPIDHHAALIYTMMLVAAADREMTDAEMQVIGNIVNHLPAFRGYDGKRLTLDLKECAVLLGADEGLEETLKAIRKAVPAKLKETAYAVACDVAAAGTAGQEVLRLLELLRQRLGIERLVAAGIERGAQARFACA
jgi:tellurite resistance protein